MSRVRGGQWLVAIGPIAYVFECSLHRSTHIFRTQNACEGPRLYAAASLKSTRLRKLFDGDAQRGPLCCSARSAWNIASSTSASAMQLAGSTNGFGPPAFILAYFACMLYCAP